MNFQRRLSPSVQPDLVPMIDIVFQLVIFFLMSSTFVVSPGIALDLPQSRSTENVATDALNIIVQESGRIFIDDTQYDLATLEDYLESTSFSGTTPVSILAEPEVPYQVVINVLDVLRTKGFRSVALRAEVLEEQ